MNSGSFRMDLYYRLNVLRLDPLLRERLDDLEKAQQLFREHPLSALRQERIQRHARDAGAFRGYAWPGNLRELRNIIERSLVNARSGAPFGQWAAWGLGAGRAADGSRGERA
ncbi:MAG: hypothetical protein ACLUEK_06140 [Oscillospiraceae bacterium]